MIAAPLGELAPGLCRPRFRDRTGFRCAKPVRTPVLSKILAAPPAERRSAHKKESSAYLAPPAIRHRQAGARPRGQILTTLNPPPTQIQRPHVARHLAS